MNTKNLKIWRFYGSHGSRWSWKKVHFFSKSLKITFYDIINLSFNKLNVKLVKKKVFFHSYSCLIASIGLLLAADFAGAIPKINPINVATKNDNKIELKESMVSIPVVISKI